MAKTTKPKAKTPTRGVLIIACGHPYYGRYAANLAMSLRFSSPDVKIAIAHDWRGISMCPAHELQLFDKQINIKDQWINLWGAQQYIMSKLYLYDMTPFDQTLYLDADIAWHPKKGVEQCMESLDEIDFTMQNRGYQDMADPEFRPMASHWVDLNELKTAYGIKSGRFWHLSSEFVWFKKTPEVRQMFKDAQDHYKTIRVGHTSFAGGVPDELPLALSMLKNIRATPHIMSYTPIFWNQAEKNERSIDLSDMYSRYYGYSMGGAANPTHAKNYYNNLIQHYARALGISSPFKYKDKREFIPERTSI